MSRCQGSSFVENRLSWGGLSEEEEVEWRTWAVCEEGGVYAWFKIDQFWHLVVVKIRRDFRGVWTLNGRFLLLVLVRPKSGFLEAKTPQNGQKCTVSGLERQSAKRCPFRAPTVKTFISATEPPDPRRVSEGFLKGFCRGL